MMAQVFGSSMFALDSFNRIYTQIRSQLQLSRNYDNFFFFLQVTEKELKAVT